MKQTAVEWLYENILLTPLDIRSINKCLEQAKEIEKQYIMDAFIVGINNGGHAYKSAQEYYKKTYKK
jgi:hypothetical protein